MYSLVDYKPASTPSLIVPSDTNAFGTLKLKRNKRNSTTTGVLNRTQSMMGYLRSPDDQGIEPNRNTYFSPELDRSKRNQKLYRSILFRKKNYSNPKDNSVVDNDTNCT